jgi:hypothetical protein
MVGECYTLYIPWTTVNFSLMRGGPYYAHRPYRHALAKNHPGPIAYATLAYATPYWPESRPYHDTIAKTTPAP